MAGLARGALDSVMSVFRTPTPATGAPQGTPTGAPTPDNKTAPNPKPGDGSDGSVAAIPATPEGEKSPLDGYLKLWETSDKDAKPAELTPDLSFDPKALAEHIGKQNFTQSIPKELVAKALAGDGDAFSAAMNKGIQQAVMLTTASMMTFVKNTLTAQEANFNEKVMPEVLRRHSASSAIDAENPIFQNAAVKPMLDMAKAQLTAKYPTMSPQEIAAEAKKFVLGMSSEIIKASGGTVDIPQETPAGTPVAPKNPMAVKDSIDWSKWLETPTS